MILSTAIITHSGWIFLMIYFLKKQRKLSCFIPVMGVLLVTTAFSSTSFSQIKSEQGSVDNLNSPALVVEKVEVVSGLSIPKAFLESEIQNTSANPTPQEGATNSYGQFEYGSGPEDLILAVVTKQRRLSAGIFAVQNNGRYYLPVAGLSQIFGFYYDFDAADGVVEGWGVSEDDKYVIDAQNNNLRFRGDKIKLPSDSILSSGVASDDLYASIEVLNQIWPMQMDVNLSSLTLRVLPDSKLPYELADQREAARERSLMLREARLENKQAENFPLVPYPYQLYSKPSIDLSSTLGYRAEADNVFATLSASGVNDLAYASADYSITAEQVDGEFRNPENFRFRLRRQNIHEGALPFGLEDTQLGDVNLNNRELISNSSGGRGFVFSTESYDKSGEFDVVTVEGVSVPGWEVELYLNNELIDFNTVADNGEYRFEDVSIGFGNNRFRIVLYGPQGQIRERVENYLYQSSMVEAGKNVFSGGVVDAQRDLFSIDERANGRAKGLTANLYAARGINNKLTAFGTANVVRDKVFGNDISREYVSAGAVASLGNSIGQLEVYKQLDGGEAFDLRTLSNFYGFNVNSQISVFRDFESPDASFGTDAKTLETDFSVKRIFSTVVGALGLELRRNHLRRETGPDTTRYNTRQSLGVSGVRATNTTTTSLVDGSHTNTNGRFSTSSRYNRWNLRNTLSYGVFPEAEAQSFQTEWRYGRSRDWTTSFNGNYNFLTDEKRLGAQLSKDFKTYLGSIETNWSSQGGFGFQARMSTSFGPYGVEGEDDYLFRSQPLANVGAAQAFVYDDRDYDGQFSEGDEPVQGARVQFARRATKEKTNENGVINEFIAANNKVINVQMVDSSIENPYLVSKELGYKIFPRPGVRQKLEFPLIETGAIDGTLRWSSQGKPIAGVRLQLLNDDGEVIQSTQTAVDGYYTFEQIPPGQYTIRPNPEDGLDIPFQYVDVTRDDLFKFGTDISGTGAADEDVIDGLDFGTTEVADDGTINVQNILSLAKGYKGKGALTATRATIDNKAQQPSAMLQKASTGVNAKSVVKAVRIGDHSDKIRIVMDLSGPVQYEINYDPQSNMIFVNIPYVSWGATDSWQSKTGDILSNYRVEKTQNGVQLVIAVANNIEVGASGLLKAASGKDDRLFIDIEKK